jgi:DNA-binding response OmpR family regulator
MDNNLQILLVEDDADSREALCRLLAGQGHRVHPVHDFGSALDIASREPIDLLVSDIGLPFVSEEDEARCLAAGFAHYLYKPVKFSDVLEAVSSFPRRADIPAVAG